MVHMLAECDVIATKCGRMEKSMACTENMSNNSQGETPSCKYFMTEHTKRLRICIAAAHNIAISSFDKVLAAAEFVLSLSPSICKKHQSNNKLHDYQRSFTCFLQLLAAKNPFSAANISSRREEISTKNVRPNG